MRTKRYHGNNSRDSMTGRIAAKNYTKYRDQLAIALQMCKDAATIALDDMFCINSEQAIRFGNIYAETLNEIAKLLVEDSKDDPKIEWSTEKVDQRLRKIFGDENFMPWERRYGQ